LMSLISPSRAARCSVGRLGPPSGCNAFNLISARCRGACRPRPRRGFRAWDA
jgi:hypothetical protein